MLPVPASMRYRCRHATFYDYGEDVAVSHHQVHLTARPHPRQRCRRTSIQVGPAPAARADHIDYFGNPVSYFAVQEPHRQLDITAESEIEVFAPEAIDLDATPPWEVLASSPESVSSPDDRAEIIQYAFDSTLVTVTDDLAGYAAGSFTPGRPAGAASFDLMRRIYREFTFDPTATTVATPLDEVMRNRRGVCQDFAHVLIGCMRSLGLPARYVSGYLRTMPPPGQPRLVGADVSHAWVSAWCGDGMWLDLCPTNGRIADQDYITLAWGRDYDDVSPVRGVIFGGAGHHLRVEVDVEPLEDPLVQGPA
jgi:transglutaminase-like putative cysteine protease